MATDVPEPGELMWAKMSGHPWWPGIVCDCPEALTHVKTGGWGTRVHIYFYNTPPSRAWLKVKQLRAFVGREDPDCKKGGLYYSNKKSLTAALKQAEQAQYMTLQERLAEVNQDGSSEGGGRGRKRRRQEASPAPAPSPKKLRSAPATPSPKKPGPGPAATPSPKRRKPGPKSKTRQFASPEETYRYKGRVVPERWKTPFVLMNTTDIPEELTTTGSIRLPSSASGVSGKSVQHQGESSVEETEEEDEELLDNYDEEEDWTPGNKEDDPEEEEEDPEEEEEDLVDSDEDPGWQPGGVKPVEVKKPTKFGRGKKRAPPRLPKPSPSTSSSSLTFSVKPKAAPTEKSKPTEATLVDNSSSSSSGSKPDSTVPSSRRVMPQDDTATGPEPDVGDFLIDKDDVKEDSLPFIWRYKKSGLIQKYGRVEEKGRVLYESLLNYSDWWGCYAHKFVKVRVQVIYKYRNKEKIAILEVPEEYKHLMPQPSHSKSSSNTSQSSPKTTTTSSQPKPVEPRVSATSVRASPPSASASRKEPSPSPSPPQTDTEQTQEQEISSTTPEPDFQIGSFVLDMKDQRNVDNFAIWKIESQILLKKYEPTIKQGKVLHKAVKTYRGYKEIGKWYVPIQVRKVDMATDDLVEVIDDSRPKLDVNTSMEDTYEKNPLLTHFYAYLQVFLSQALEPGFLDEIHKTQDSTYMFPMKEIDKLIKQKCTNIERKVRWTPKAKDALVKCPHLREVPKSELGRTCEAISDTRDTVLKTVFLFGPEYDAETLKESGTSHTCQEVKIGKTASSHIMAYHQLSHFKYNLYVTCLAKIKVMRETSKKELEVTDIMDSCLGNKAWVLQNFEDFMKLVELS